MINVVKFKLKVMKLIANYFKCMKISQTFLKQLFACIEAYFSYKLYNKKICFAGNSANNNY
jgi:hypothetical protein